MSLSEGTPPTLPELTVGRFLSSWEPDVPALLVIMVLAALYGWGLLRLKGRGEPWSAARTAAFALLGLGTLSVATMSALAVYNRALFWPAAVQNVLLDLIAPLGLALGDPLRLAVQALPEHGADLVRRLMRGRLVRVLTFPLVSTALVLTTELTVYFTPYFETALANGWLHELMYLQLLLTGSLFVVPVLTHEQALPAWCTHPVRAALVFVDGIVDAVPGIVVMTHSTLIAGAWYLSHAPSWAPEIHQDQQLGGGAMLSIAELVSVPFLLAILVQWVRFERAQTLALDRRLDTELIPAAPAPGQARSANPDRVRPWWETENSTVAERLRKQSPRT
ncbi:cytochrome c oxidase assembly protein [Streptomyces sp. NPDC046557]|uniref:cytochrome c oxidase assembly protein n=1 Tax=Streptomyces sp. NPDC046557 TaxID=3155372 RepID=UPI0033C36E5C